MQKDESETLRREETCPRPHRGKRRCRGGRWFPRLLQRGGGERGGGERGGRMRGEGRPALPLRSPSSLLAVRLLQGSPVRPDHRCRPRSLVGVARPAPTSLLSGNLRLTRLFPDRVPQAALGAGGPGAASQTQAHRLAVLLLGIGRIAHCPAETNRDPALPAQTWKSQEGPQTSVPRGPTSREKWAAVILLSNWA